MDLFLFQYINSFAGRWLWLDFIAVFSAEYLGYLLLAVFLGVAIFYRKNHGMELFLYALFSAAFSRLIITEIIRFFYFKPRPFEVLDVHQLIFHNGGGAFPSGHATFFFALATAIFFYNKKWGAVFFAATILMSISRVISGIHWPADILGGAILGILSSIFIMWLKKKIPPIL